MQISDGDKVFVVRKSWFCLDNPLRVAEYKRTRYDPFAEEEKAKSYKDKAWFFGFCSLLGSVFILCFHLSVLHPHPATVECVGAGAVGMMLLRILIDIRLMQAPKRRFQEFAKRVTFLSQIFGMAVQDLAQLTLAELQEYGKQQLVEYAGVVENLPKLPGYRNTMNKLFDLLLFYEIITDCEGFGTYFELAKLQAEKAEAPQVVG